jgi:outer membrane protein OmpA-like peptidoglycan-associated protein
LSLEPGLAVPLTSPQSQIFDVGGEQTVKLLFGLTRTLSIGPSAAFTSLPASSSTMDSGTSWTFGAGARLMRPHDGRGGARGFYAVSPWIDADVLYVRTGGLDRMGFAAASGIAVPIDDNRRFWIGPYVRYSHIFQGDRTGFDNRDAKILTVGIGVEFGTGLESKLGRTPVATPPPPEVAEVPPVADSDRDNDAVADRADNCPDVAGPIENSGCPLPGKVVVKPDRLELTDKIGFPWDSAVLHDDDHAVLDEVVRVLKANPGVRVRMEGHASSEGAEAHNQALSERRASAVLDYLIAGGIARERLTSQGFSSSVPVASNLTVAGREQNRRVEFVVDFIIINGGNTP